MRELTDNPGAIRASSTIQRSDFYGNLESFIVDTFRLGAHVEIFIQRMAAADPYRIMLPPEVTDVIGRQRDRCVTVARKRAARSAVATKRAAGIDPAAALRAHRASGGARRRTRKDRAKG
jgi:hypothetical protein